MAGGAATWLRFEDTSGRGLSGWLRAPAERWRRRRAIRDPNASALNDTAREAKRTPKVARLASRWNSIFDPTGDARAQHPDLPLRSGLIRSHVRVRSRSRWRMRVHARRAAAARGCRYARIGGDSQPLKDAMRKGRFEVPQRGDLSDLRRGIDSCVAAFVSARRTRGRRSRTGPERHRECGPWHGLRPVRGFCPRTDASSPMREPLPSRSRGADTPPRRGAA